MEAQEVWKNIVEFENYEVSSFGKVRNKKTGRVLKASNHGGYYYDLLSKDGKCLSFSVHRLVCIAFIPNVENNPTDDFASPINDCSLANSLFNINLEFFIISLYS